MRVIGTAGHVDHGKSTLVEALTGTHPDRLKEEREREMTIDLGFAWLTLPGGEEVGIVDVPGHRDFIENMLAGVGGIDAVLFVISCDEGVMPQTREHLAILDILQVGGGVIALTKVDLVNDSEWLDLVEEDLRAILSGSVLAEAPILRISARTRQGIPELIAALSKCLEERPARPDLGRPRLPVDRVFTIPGFGTVVTGTLLDGSLHIGDEIQILPAGIRGRVRGLQTHKHKEDLAVPGSRTAINISGVDLAEVHRGDVIAHPADYTSTRRMDVRFRLLPDVSMPLEHNTEVKLFIGSAEVVARVRLLGCEILQPGETGWLQLEHQHPVVAVRGDRYILLRPSPGETLGGGAIVDPHPKGRHKRFSSDTIARLETLSQGTPIEVFMQALIGLGIAPLREALAKSNLNEKSAHSAVEAAFSSGQIIDLEAKPSESQLPLPDSLVTTRVYWEQYSQRIIQEIEAYHRSYPLRRGMPREELKSRMKLHSKSDLSNRTFLTALHRLAQDGAITESGPLVLCKGFMVNFPPNQQILVESLLNRFKESPYSPPSVKECLAEVGEEIYNALIDQGFLVAVSSEVVFRKQDYGTMLNEVSRLLQSQGTITAAEVRDHFNTSRKYALAFLEYLDSQGVTVREGDVRKLKADFKSPG